MAEGDTAYSVLLLAMVTMKSKALWSATKATEMVIYTDQKIMFYFLLVSYFMALVHLKSVSRPLIKLSLSSSNLRYGTHGLNKLLERLYSGLLSPEKKPSSAGFFLSQEKEKKNNEKVKVKFYVYKFGVWKISLKSNHSYIGRRFSELLKYDCQLTRFK